MDEAGHDGIRWKVWVWSVTLDFGSMWVGVVVVGGGRRRVIVGDVENRQIE